MEKLYLVEMWDCGPEMSLRVGKYEEILCEAVECANSAAKHSC